MSFNPVGPSMRRMFPQAAADVHGSSGVGVAARLQQLRAAAVRGDRAAIQEQIPEFAALARTHNSDFHLYDMDQHTFVLITTLLADPAVSGRVSDTLILGSLLHDIGKPAVATEKNGKTQYIKHDVVGADTVAPPILDRLGVTGQERDQILALTRFHMRPVDLLGQLAGGTLQDKTIKGFVNDVLVPLEMTGIDLTMILAFARADLISARGPECCKRYGVAADNEAAFVARMDQLVSELSSRISGQRSAISAAQAVPAAPAPLVSGGDLNGVFKPGKHFGLILGDAKKIQAEQPALDRPAILAILRERFPQHLVQ